MVKVEIRRYGKTKCDLGKVMREMILDVENMWFDFQAEAIEIGQYLHDYVKKYIKEHIKRPGSTGRLVNSITYDEKIAMGEIGFAIGDIEVLDRETEKSWRAINWGSSHLVGKHMKRGYFRPGKAKPDRAEFRKGRWYSTGGKMSKYRPVVKNPIPPMYFVEALIIEAKRAIGKLIAKTISKAGKK